MGCSLGPTGTNSHFLGTYGRFLTSLFNNIPQSILVLNSFSDSVKAHLALLPAANTLPMSSAGCPHSPGQGWHQTLPGPYVCLFVSRAGQK